MELQILKIVLWPFSEAFEPRQIEFKENVVNVVSGIAKTGKSAIIPIIDYCLGAEKCTIPVRVIRNTCEWFGVVVATSEGQKLFARRNPGDQRSTGDMYILEGAQIEVPKRIPGRNASVDSIKRKLDELSGLSSLQPDPDAPNSYHNSRPSFRDLAAFNFQPQNIVANPNVLFFKVDSNEHREKLRTIFPYILGAVSPGVLAARQELGRLQKEFRKRSNEMAALRAASERWVAEIRARMSQARELGLTTESVEGKSFQELIAALRRVVQHSEINLRTTADTVTGAIDELGALGEEESSVSAILSGLRRRLESINELKASTSQYQNALGVQRDRLRVAEWLSQMHAADQSCPVCGNQMEQAASHLSELLIALQDVERTAASFETAPAVVDRELARVTSDISVAAERLRGIRTRIRATESTSKEAERRRYTLLAASRFIGSLESDLKTFGNAGQDSELRQEIEELRSRIEALQKVLSGEQIEERTRRALSIIQGKISRILPTLDAENPDSPVSLDIDELTLRIQSLDREDYLWELGSGSNWVSYHIACLLALHDYFADQSASPVPNFMVVDQPSQVYFPANLNNTAQTPSAEPPEDEDVRAVRKIYRALSSETLKEGVKLQVIVCDHADASVWQQVPNIYLAASWRGNDQLVPTAWIS
jgi:hypothetical protein